MGNSIKVAAAQITPIPFKMRETASKVCDYIDEASKNNAQLVVFPEMAVGGYPGWRPQNGSAVMPPSKLGSKKFLDGGAEWVSKKLFEISEPIPGPTMQILCKKARSCGIHVVTGFAEADQVLRGVIYNTAVFIDYNGEIIGKHRKIHTGSLEYFYWKKGDIRDIAVFNTSLGKVGLAICYDVMFPEFTRLLDLMGEEIQCEIWACPVGWEFLCDNYPIVRATEGGIFVVSSNLVGEEKEINLVFKGHSMIVDPFGRVLAKAGEKEEIIYGDIDLQVINDYRTSGQFSLGLDRREDLYEIRLHKREHQKSAKEKKIEQQCRSRTSPDSEGSA